MKLKIDEKEFWSLMPDSEITTMTPDEQNAFEKHSAFINSNLVQVLPKAQDLNAGAFLEANVQYRLENAYIALYQSTEEEKRDLIFPVVIARTKTTAAHYTKRSGWNCFQLIYTNAGSGVVIIRNRMYRLTPGSVFLLDCRPYHYFYTDDPEQWDYSFILYDGGGSGYFCSAMEDALLVDDMASSRASRIFERIFSASKEDPEDFGILFHTWMTDLLLCMYLEKGRSSEHWEVPEWLAEVENYIAQHCEEQINVSELAAMVYLSSGRFAHLFKELVGCPPIEYQHRIRIRKAMDLLENTDLPAMEISRRSGYQNISGFYAKFRKATGMTPVEYRQRGYFRLR